MIKYCHRLVNLTTEFPLLKDTFSCCKDLHSKGRTSWYASIDILLKILNIDHNTLSYNKNKFNTILQQIVHKKYMNDWQQKNESMKNGNLKTYLLPGSKNKLCSRKVSYYSEQLSL